jgi:phosphoglycerate kinase
MMKFLEKTDPKKLIGTAVLRLDFNSEDNWRLEAAVPTVKFLLKTADKVVILSHRGRPGKAERKLSLRGDAQKLSKFLKRKIIFLGGFNFGRIKREVKDAPYGSVFVLENLRFLPGEEKNSLELAENLAGLGDYYVNDAFAVSHRAHASVAAITNFLPSYAGLGLTREILILCKVMSAPKKPLVVVLGGGKAYDKLGVLNYLKRKADSFLIGGAPANTLSFLAGVTVGNSLREKDPRKLKELKKILNFPNIVLPVDFQKKGGDIFDIGSVTAEIFADRIAKAKTIIWAGPLGFFEDAKFANGSITVGKAILKNKRAFSVVGGGETVSFLRRYKLTKAFDFVSTGGGAMLEFLAGEKLPGMIALEKNDKIG